VRVWNEFMWLSVRSSGGLYKRRWLFG